MLVKMVCALFLIKTKIFANTKVQERDSTENKFKYTDLK